MAAIASEDQNFANHWGIDFASVQEALEEYERGQGLRGASTITQQMAKNFFLWPNQSYLRKGIEAYFNGCLTLTLDSYKVEDYERDDSIYIVDPLYGYTTYKKVTYNYKRF
jgi:membrane peptidoglycan carboxypeptidase